MFEILKKQGLVMSIALSDIVPNPAQPRRTFDEKELFALGESIRENGLIQPISVRKIKSGFELIAGERRFRACKLIGREKIEAIVYDIGDEDSATWALIENLQRSDLGPFEEAEALFKLISSWNLPRDEAARRIGFAPSTLSNKLRIYCNNLVVYYNLIALAPKNRIDTSVRLANIGTALRIVNRNTENSLN